MTFILLLIIMQDRGVDVSHDSAQIDTTNTINYQAKKIIFDIDNSTVILLDSSEIIYGDIQLLSDSAYYHTETKQLEAFGTCDLRQLDDSIKGSYLRYNIENKKALMKNGRTQIDNGFLTGREIYWIDKQTVNAYHGQYTTCSDSPPHYYFYSPKMKVYLGDMVIARPIVLVVQGFPVMAAPFWFVPISSKRKSGLLPFRAGNSGLYGKYIRGLAYYVVISDYADMTMQIDAYEKKGIMPQAEWVWDFSPFTNGKVFCSYIKETDTKNQRYNIEARNNSAYFLLGSSFNCDIKYASDNTYRKDYTDTTVLWLEKEILSQATLKRTIGSFRNTLSFERKEKFTDTMTTSTTQKFPNYTITTPSRTLFGIISYSSAGHINRERSVTTTETRDVSGANVHVGPSMQQTLFQALSVSPRADFDFAVFDEDTMGNTLPARFGYSFGISASTNFYRVFGINLLSMQGVLHKVSPKCSWSYTPDFDYSHLPTVGGIPNFFYRNIMTFGVDQVLEAKIGEEEVKRILTKLNLSSSYNFLNDTLAPVALSLELPYNPFPKPIETFRSQYNATYNTYTKDYRYSISNTSGINLDFFTINLNQRYTEDGLYQIWFNGTLKPTPKWLLTYAARYDWDNKEVVDYSFGLKRDIHCWEAVFKFNQLGDTWRYDFQVRIKDIPDVTIGKGLLGYILE